MKGSIFILLASLFLCFNTIANDLVSHITSVTFIVESPSGYSSGVVLKSDTNIFILTACHAVVGDDNKPESPVFVGQVVSGMQREDFVLIYLSSLFKVEAFNEKLDVALLKPISLFPFNKEGAKLYNEEIRPPIGSDLWHCGNYLGARGFRMVTKGIYSKYDVPSFISFMPEKVFDAGDYGAKRGCSGGGVWIDDGRMVGITCQIFSGAGSDLTLFVTSDRIVSWLKQEGYSFLIQEKNAVKNKEAEE